MSNRTFKIVQLVVLIAVIILLIWIDWRLFAYAVAAYIGYAIVSIKNGRFPFPF